MIVVTTPNVPGMKISRCMGLVRGNTVRGRHLGRDITAMLRLLAGGEIREYSKLMGETREQAIDRMVEEARGLGANAVVAVRFQTAEVTRGAAEMLCYGTAVWVEPEDG
ncbi:MAG: YbjQ family protein [Gemmatimonadota bacterium]